MKCNWPFNSKEHLILVSGNTKWVNLINESRWHLLKSFCSGAAEVDATAPLPPSNKYMDNCWPRLLDTLTSCLNNCGGTQLGQLLLLLLAVRQLLPILEWFGPGATAWPTVVASRCSSFAARQQVILIIKRSVNSWLIINNNDFSVQVSTRPKENMSICSCSSQAT